MTGDCLIFCCCYWGFFCKRKQSGKRLVKQERFFSKVLLTVWQGCFSPVFLTWSGVVNFPFSSQCCSLPSEHEMHCWCCWWETHSRCRCWETGEVMKFPPLLLKRKIFNLLCTNMKSQARLPGGSMGKDRGQHKVWDPLWGTCLCQSLLWVLGESAYSGRLSSGGFLLSWGRKYPSCAINVHSAEHHLKDHGARSVGEMSSGLAMCSPTLMSVTLIALAWFLHMCVW